MNQANASEIWWPHPSALDDLTIVETDSGFELAAPADTECGEWLAYFNENQTRKNAFQRAFIEMLSNYIKLTENGQTQDQPDEQESNRVQAEENSPGAVS